MSDVSIFGLGYVGTVTAACLSEAGKSVIGVDVQEEKVNSLAAGRSPVVEPEVDALLAQACREQVISATCDWRKAVMNTKVSIVCVGTPSLENGRLDLRYVEQVTSQIAEGLAEKNEKHLLIYRSTMLPGSTRQLVSESFQKFVDSGRLEVLFVPEFLREGTAVADFRSPSLSVIGTCDGMPAQASEFSGLLNPINPSIVRWEEAETIKYACNAFHAIKVGFANEIGRLAKGLGLDSRSIMQTLCKDTKLNISEYYLRPGAPFGGSCLPKDVAALTSLALRVGVKLPLVEALEESNRRQQELLLERVIAAKRQRIGILGLSFKSATDDLRNSPMVFLAEALLGKGYEVVVFDPQLRMDRLIGTNKSIIEKVLPHLNRLLCNDPRETIDNCDVVVVSQRCVSMNELRGLIRPDQHIIDVDSWPELETLPCKYEGLCWDSSDSTKIELDTAAQESAELAVTVDG